MNTVIIAILGRPNAGKSTFMNLVVGESLAPVSSVPNTTRLALKGIYTDGQTQFVFIDVPGLQLGRSALLDTIRKESFGGLSDAHAILWLTDRSRPLGEEEDKIEQIVTQSGKPFLRVYTKGDLTNVARPPQSAVCISTKNPQLERILEYFRPHAQIEGVLYDADLYSDTTRVARATEIIREQAISRLMEEIPHALYARIEDITIGLERIRMLAYIVVETESQKKIVIGLKGSKISEI